MCHMMEVGAYHVIRWGAIYNPVWYNLVHHRRCAIYSSGGNTQVVSICGAARLAINAEGQSCASVHFSQAGLRDWQIARP